jgi:Uma2 family endonuclease
LIDYRTAGIPLIWIINPHARTVKVHRPRQPIVELGEMDQLTGDSILPGFSTAVSELFPAIVQAVK